MSERLKFYYVSHRRGSLKQQKVVLKPTDLISNMKRLGENGNKCAVDLDDIIIGVSYRRIYESDKDVRCNSQYMIEVMSNFGQMMREAYHWIAKDTKNASSDWVGGHPIYFVMDNMG